MRGGEADSGPTESDTSSSTAFSFKAIFFQDGHRPSNHCISPHGHWPSSRQPQASSTGMARCSGRLLPVPPPPPTPPAQVARPGSRQVDVKYKTRLCRFHQQGLCKNGSACTFAHSEVDLRIGPATMQALHEVGIPTPYKTKPCFFWGKGKCKRGSMCPFAHCSGELPEAARHSEGSAGELSEEDQRRVKAAFDVFDESGQGWLDYEELKQVMRILDHEPGEWELFEVFGNRSVPVRYEEFLKMMTHKIRGSVERRNDVSQARRSAAGSAGEDQTGRATPATDVASPPSGA